MIADITGSSRPGRQRRQMAMKKTRKTGGANDVSREVDIQGSVSRQDSVGTAIAPAVAFGFGRRIIFATRTERP